MNLKKAMERNRLEKTNSLLGGFGLEKGKAAAMGEERVHGGVKVKKTPQGWVPVGSGKEKATPEKKTAPGSKKPEPASKTSSPIASQPGGAKPGAPAGAKPAVPGAAKPAGQPGGQEQPQVGGHEIAQLTHIKTVLKTDPAKAYEIYQSLTPEGQAVVPQEVVNQLVATAHKPVEEDKVDFKDLGKKPAEKKTEVKKEKPAEGDYIVANNGDSDFYAKIDFIEDGEVYFTSGDDQYHSSLKSATSEKGGMRGKGLWKVDDYDS